MEDLSILAPNLRRHERGFWCTEESARVSYPEGAHDGYYQFEASSFWFRHRNRCITALVGSHPPPEGGPIYDVGGGNGIVSLALQEAGHQTVLLEPGPAGAQNALRRGVRDVVCADFSSVAFAPSSLAAVGLFDVVEHIERPEPFLEAAVRALRPGGRVYLTVPAYQALWSHEDVHAGHYRRYNARTLRALLEAVGLAPSFVSYFFSPLPLPVFALRRLPYLLGVTGEGGQVAQAQAQHTMGSEAMVRLIERMLSFEVAALSRGRALPFGGSLIAVADKAG